MAFKMRERTYEDARTRANQRGNNNDNWLKDGVNVFKPAEGDNCIRYFPIPADVQDEYKLQNHYGMDCYVHYGIGGQFNSYPCLEQWKPEQRPAEYRDYGTKCPVCEYKRQLEAEKAPKEETKELGFRKAVLAYVLDRNREQDGPLPWPMTMTMDKEFSLLSIDKTDNTLLPIEHPDKGYDVLFKREGSGLNTKYPGKQIARKPSFLHRDENVQDQLLQYVVDHPLPSLIKFYTYEEISASLNGAARDDEGGPAERPARGERLRDRYAESQEREDRRGAQEEPEPRAARSREAEPEERTPRRRSAVETEREPEPDARSAGDREEDDGTALDHDGTRYERATGEVVQPARRGRDEGRDGADQDANERGRAEASREPPERAPRRRSAEPEDRPARTEGRGTLADEPPARRRPVEDAEPAPARRRPAAEDPPARSGRGSTTEAAPERRRPAAEPESRTDTTTAARGRLANLRR